MTQSDRRMSEAIDPAVKAQEDIESEIFTLFQHLSVFRQSIVLDQLHELLEDDGDEDEDDLTS